jgi:hypothetical protein
LDGRLHVLSSLLLLLLRSDSSDVSFTMLERSSSELSDSSTRVGLEGARDAGRGFFNAFDAFDALADGFEEGLVDFGLIADCFLIETLNGTLSPESLSDIL